MSKTAIVIGGTGVVGREVVEQLATAPHIDKVVSLARRSVENTSPRVINHQIDFDNLAAHAQLFQGVFFFSCLGTTLKQAGSIEAQRRVDLDYQYQCAELAAAQGCAHYLLVSSSGANRHSPLAYSKMKGELEHRVKQLPFESVTIMQPSLLLGERSEKRTGEELAAAIMPALCKLPGLRKMRPIRGDEVARKMVAVSADPRGGVTTYSLDEIFC
ncbi:MAG: NAD(P)H-binding protein [Gammaproteobacteria bacterium]|nr:NAD(P)H-binding protein [Gammaproteobacteria bacterium]